MKRLGKTVPNVREFKYLCSLIIFAQIRADFYSGVIRTKFVSLCLFVRMDYFLNISLKTEIEFKLAERKLT